jgi:cell division protein FtsI (penicillin-binding protein 3)
MIAVFLVFILASIGVLIKAGQATLFPEAKLSKFERRKFEQTVEIKTRRGMITDRNGEQLALTISGHSLFADPKIIVNPTLVSRKLAKELSIDASEILKLLKKKSRFVWIERKLSLEKRDAIEKLNVKGLGFQEEDTRIYPQGRLAAHAIGFVNQSDKGAEGLEKQYNKPLTGPQRTVTAFRDARGRLILNQGGWFSEQFEGHNVVLNIDAEVQFELMNELRRAKRENDSDGAFGVVLEAKTSRIVAIGSVPDFDPNQPMAAPKQFLRHRAVTDIFEPGSVIKPLVVAGAIDEGIVKANTIINCENGKWQIKGHTLREADAKHSWSELTVADILSNSSNIGTAKIAMMLGEEKIKKYLKLFGVGRKTGIDFPGEATGILPKAPWSQLSLATVSYGHGLSVSPLQIAAAYAVIASDGRYRVPQMVREIRNSRGEVETEFPVSEGTPVIDAKLAEHLRLILAGTINETGTAVKARVPGYPVAGKTGTAMKVNPLQKGYIKGGYISSFVGMIPANNPEYVIYVGVDHPREGYYASTVAAPIFSRLSEFAMRHAKIEPVVVNANKKADIKQPAKSSIVSKVLPQTVEAQSPIGLSLREALQYYSASNLLSDIKIVGHGKVKKVVRDNPKSNRLTLVLSPEG